MLLYVNVNAQWSSNPSVSDAISTAAGDQQWPTIVSDGSAKAIITYYDYRSGANNDIYAQRILSGGTLLCNPPTVTISATATTVCAGASITLTGGGANTYTWTGGVTNGVAFVPTATTTYTVTGTITATGCTNTATITITVSPIPNAIQPNYPPYTLCDFSGAVGYETFDLGSKITDILLGQTGMDVAFYPSLLAAQTNTNAITNLNYTNTSIDVQTLGIRVTNMATGCYAISTMGIKVEPLPTLTPPTQPYTVCDDNQDGYANFDLTTLLPGLLSGITPSVTVTFHETLQDAHLLTNAINTSVLYFSINPFVQIIYVRAEDNVTGCFSVILVELNANPSLIAPINLSIPPICDSDNNSQDATTGVNLTQANAGILAQQPLAPSNYTVTYYTTQLLAQGGTSMINLATNYIGTNGQIIWVRVENNVTNSFNIGSFQLVINVPLFLTTPAPLRLCDDDALPNNQFHTFNLTVKTAQINQGTTATVTYYPSFALAQAGAAGTAIGTPTAYTNIFPAVQTLGVVVTTTAGCQSITTLDIRVLPIPTPNRNPPALAPQCDDNNPGDMLEIFNLTTNAEYISNGDPNVMLHYFATQADAIANTNELIPANAALVGQNVWIRVENNRVDYLGNNCYVLVEQALTVNPLPTVVQPLAPYGVCDDNADGIAVFDLTNPSLAPAFLGATQLPAGYTISYYLTVAGANPATNPVETPLPTSYTNVIPTSQDIYIRVVNNATGCVNATGVLTLLAVGQSSEVPSPIGAISQTFDPGDTLANVSVSGSDIQWYASPSSNPTPLPLNTVLVDGTTYYATQTICGIESIAMLPVTVYFVLGLPANEVMPLHFYPNPVENVLTLQSNVIMKSVLVYNLLGQKVYEQSLNDTYVIIDLSNLHTGNYIAKVQGETAQKVIKIIKK